MSRDRHAARTEADFEAETGPGVQVTHPAREAEQIKESPAEGVYIHGLYLDGCAWSGRENKLVDAEPKKLFNPLPVLYVTGVLVSPPGWTHCLKYASHYCSCKSDAPMVSLPRWSGVQALPTTTKDSTPAQL